MDIKGYIQKKFRAFGFVCLLPGILCGCHEEQGISEDPYAGGKTSLGVKLVDVLPTPESGYPGDTVVFKAQGLLKYCDPASGKYEFQFYLSDELTEIVSVTDTAITVKVPANLSSGIAYLKLQDQVFYGPRFTVLGNILVDHAYQLKEGTDEGVYAYLPVASNGSGEKGYYFGGAFFNAGGKKRIGLAMVSDKGALENDYTSNFNVSQGLGSYSVSQYVASMTRFRDDRVLISGRFYNYEGPKIKNQIKVISVNHMAVLKKDFSLDTAMISVNVNGSTAYQFTASRFNGGTNGAVVRSFITDDQKVIALGNFTRYYQTNYEISNEEDQFYRFKDVHSVIRMEGNGDLDESYRFSTGYSGAEGNITDAYMDSEDRVVIVGDFVNFDGKTVNSIVRLKADGNIDEEFLANIGSGANGGISMVRYNRSLDKAMIVGNFTEFNGKPRLGVAMINGDGTLNEEFVPREIKGGWVNFATLLDRGKIVISGTFSRYDGVTRPGFLILDSDGKAMQDFNVPGTFSGQLYHALETKNTLGTNGLLLLGDIYRFNNQKVNNVVMLECEY